MTYTNFFQITLAETYDVSLLPVPRHRLMVSLRVSLAASLVVVVVAVMLLLLPLLITMIMISIA